MMGKQLVNYIEKSNKFSLNSGLDVDLEDTLFIVIGGTSWKVGIFNNSTLEILGKGKVGRLQKGEELLNILSDLKNKYFPNCSSLMINLAFPIKEVDGQKIIYKNSKGHDLKGILDIDIEKYLSKKLNVRTMVFNDAFVLANNSDHENSISLIVGTGFNIGFKKNDVFYNTEMGKFNEFEIPIDLSYIKRFGGKDYNEYIVGGGYFKSHLEFLLDNQSYEEIKNKDIFELQECKYKDIVDRIYENSSKFCALSLFEVIKYMETEDVIYIQTEGSVINKRLGYKQDILKHLKKLGLKNTIKFLYTEKSYFEGMKRMQV